MRCFAIENAKDLDYQRSLKASGSETEQKQTEDKESDTQQVAAGVKLKPPRTLRQQSGAKNINKYNTEL